MHKTEYQILMLFKKNAQKELSTTEIANEVYKEEFVSIERALERTISSREEILKAKRLKGKLHRRLLHHLNKLVSEEIISVGKVTGKGEKHFRLSLEDGEEFVIGRQKRKIVISKPAMPAMPIEGYEQSKVIRKFEEATWVDRLNSLLVECNKFKGTKELYSFVSEAFSAVNDAIGLNNFESIIENNSLKNVEELLGRLSEDCTDYGKFVSIILDMTHVKDEKRLVEAIKAVERIKLENISVIFDIRAAELDSHTGVIAKAVELFSKKGIPLYIKNQDLHEAPYIVGRAGPYTFEPSEWKNYEQRFQENCYCIACGQSSIAIDVARFFMENKSLKEFRELTMNVAKALLSANSMMKRRSAEYFKNLIKANYPHTKEFFMISNSYIRLWNYGWKEPSADQETVIDLIESTKAEIKEFTQAQQTISLSCGIPTRFTIAYGPAFKEFDKESLSDEKFQKIQIRRMEDLYSDNLKEMLSAKEHIFRVFDGGDRQRFFRSGEISPEGICRELSIIIKTYKFPFFCYDFGAIRGEVKLTRFME